MPVWMLLCVKHILCFSASLALSRSGSKGRWNDFSPPSQRGLSELPYKYETIIFILIPYKEL